MIHKVTSPKIEADTPTARFIFVIGVCDSSSVSFVSLSVVLIALSVVATLVLVVIHSVNFLSAPVVVERLPVVVERVSVVVERLPAVVERLPVVVERLFNSLMVGVVSLEESVVSTGDLVVMGLSVVFLVDSVEGDDIFIKREVYFISVDGVSNFDVVSISEDIDVVSTDAVFVAVVVTMLDAVFMAVVVTMLDVVESSSSFVT